MKRINRKVMIIGILVLLAVIGAAVYFTSGNRTGGAPLNGKPGTVSQDKKAGQESEEKEGDSLPNGGETEILGPGVQAQESEKKDPAVKNDPAADAAPSESKKDTKKQSSSENTQNTLPEENTAAEKPQNAGNAAQPEQPSESQDQQPEEPSGSGSSGHKVIELPIIPVK